MTHRLILMALLWLLLSVVALPQPPRQLQSDTLWLGGTDSARHIRELVVTSRLIYREVIPSQRLTGEQLEQLSSQSVADALRYFSGVQLKDYGGVGGIKTVDVRSMGTNHLGVSYDGIVLGNAQNGQIDLGQFSLDNVEEITLYNGQKSAIFQPATDFASASSVYIRTRMPRFTHGERQHLQVRAKGGASDMLRLGGLYERRLSSDVSLSTSAELLTASGKYHFRYRRTNLDGTTAWDTTAVRHNGDILAERLEANVHGVLTQGAWQLKGYVYHSARGIPGAIVNNVWSRGERQRDLNTFVQGHLQKNIGNRFSTQWLAKYAYYNTHYESRDTTRLPVSNTYYQQELYLSSANVIELLPNWSASMSYDLRWNKLNAHLYRFAYPRRFTHALSFATAIDYRHLKVQGSVVGTYVRDKTRTAEQSVAHASLSRFTPALFANVYPLHTARWLSLRTYVKHSFRMPTFNDLYYTEIGNASLRPESATQYDVGLVLSKHAEQGWLSHVGLQTDLYYNKVKDKIIAYPKGQQFRWTMLNLGRVGIKGLDVVAEATHEVGTAAATDKRPLSVTLRLQYTYQQARDLTDEHTPYYRHQIPYIPRHSGSAIVGLSWHRLSVNYSFLYTGERWNEQENTAYNHMQPWYTSDVTANYDLPVGPHHLRLSAELNNLLNQQYDVILNYPMPGRNVIVGIKYEM